MERIIRNRGHSVGRCGHTAYCRGWCGNHDQGYRNLARDLNWHSSRRNIRSWRRLAFLNGDRDFPQHGHSTSDFNGDGDFLYNRDLPRDFYLDDLGLGGTSKCGRHNEQYDRIEKQLSNFEESHGWRRITEASGALTLRPA